MRSCRWRVNLTGAGVGQPSAPGTPARPNATPPDSFYARPVASCTGASQSRGTGSSAACLFASKRDHSLAPTACFEPPHLKREPVTSCEPVTGSLTTRQPVTSGPLAHPAQGWGHHRFEAPRPVMSPPARRPPTSTGKGDRGRRPLAHHEPKVPFPPADPVSRRDVSERACRGMRKSTRPRARRRSHSVRFVVGGLRLGDVATIRFGGPPLQQSPGVISVPSWRL